MGQEFHNYITIRGTEKARQAFVADAWRLSSQWGWDWVEVTFNSEASHGRDSGESKLNFYTKNFPLGLEELMTLHPEMILDGDYLDITMPEQHHIEMAGGLISNEWTSPLHYDEDGESIDEAAPESNPPVTGGGFDTSKDSDQDFKAELDSIAVEDEGPLQLDQLKGTAVDLNDPEFRAEWKADQILILAKEVGLNAIPKQGKWWISEPVVGPDYTDDFVFSGKCDEALAFLTARKKEMEKAQRQMECAEYETRINENLELLKRWIAFTHKHPEAAKEAWNRVHLYTGFEGEPIDVALDDFLYQFAAGSPNAEEETLADIVSPSPEPDQ